MDLSARCLVLLSCLGVILAIDLDAIDPGYYVEPTATSETIDYKDPCKAGEIWFVIVFSFSCTVYDFLLKKKKKHIYVEVKKKNATTQRGARTERPEQRFWRDDSSGCSF